MYEILDKIEKPEDIKKLNLNEIDELCEEIRDYLLKSLSVTGGHLASNLGVVELTLALFNNLDLDRDKIIWDVGHQCYVHKILTYRKEELKNIRQYNGISGFPKREESKYDAFNTGHSATSISALVGMARARDLQGTDENLLAVIGDGALTGGMAFEALNDIAKRKSRVIIILNDNEMSISENVGGLSLHLSKARVKAKYIDSRKVLEKYVDKIPLVGKTFRKILHKIKELIKKVILPRMMFEEIGLTYIGPIDGHNFKDMSRVIEEALKMEKPVLIHVCTKKGKGYSPAENNPDKFHSIGAFDIASGQPIKSKSKKTFSDVFGDCLLKKAEKNANIVAISAAMIDGTGLKTFSEKFPDRIFDVGIAEQHAVTMAAGMAVHGCIPVVAIYSTFFQRAYDQIVHDVCLQNLHVVFCADRAGLVGNDGDTHHGLFDINMFASIPNIEIFAPSNNQELEKIIDYAIDECSGPVAIRYAKGSSNIRYSDKLLNYFTSANIKKALKIREGEDLTIVTYGRFVEKAMAIAAMLSNNLNIESSVYNMRCIKPLDIDEISKSIEKTGKMLILDEGMEDNYFTNKLMTLKGDDVKIIAKNLGCENIGHGKVEQLIERCKLNEEEVYSSVVNELFLLENAHISHKIIERI